MITCQILCHSNSAHLSQIYTGFLLLHQAGEIEISQKWVKPSHLNKSRPQHLRDAARTHLRVIVNGRLELHYDCHDSYEIDEVAAAEVDCYFKRSYAPFEIRPSLRARVFPLGLNYEVYGNERDEFEKQRLSSFPGPATNENELPFRPTVENIEALPNYDLEPRLLFITRAWDPYDHPDRSAEKIEERIRINETRARCIQLLKREFGDCFVGGLIHTEYAVRNYADALLSDNQVSQKENYLNLLKGYSVCVASTGLHGSIGWKLAEYVAFSKAIVSERLKYQVPGSFKAGTNYLEFEQPEQCLAPARTLLSDTNLRSGMILINYEYYKAHLRPDAMIRRTLQVALSRPSL